MAGPMKKWNSSALTALKGKLKLKVIVKNGLNDILETEAGGFMNEAEAQMVESKPNNAEQMGEIIRILLGKSDAAFGTFCTMLRQVGYDVWATALEDKAKEEGGESGGSGSPLSGPPRDDVLARKIHGFKTKNGQTDLVILRKHVSQEAIGSGRALLAALGLRKPQIAKCYGDNPLNEEEAIQAGLETWVGKVDPTWGDLLRAMETADIDVQASDELKAKLLQ